jgi:RHS repeat-associated protein
MPAYPEQGNRSVNPRIYRNTAGPSRQHKDATDARSSSNPRSCPLCCHRLFTHPAPDQQQTILAELDRTAPNRLAYTPYGFQSGLPAARSGIGFSGQLMERPTGRYHLGNGHRVYNPVLMRFQSPDRLSPFGKGGLNPYVYCVGDPINFTDPTGEFGLAISQLIQRSLTVALHIGIPAGLLLAPKATGLALQGVRASLAGSATSAAGALLQLGGVAAGSYVANAGIALSVGGLFTRVAVTARAAYQKGALWGTVRDNLRHVFGMSTSTPTSTAASAVGRNSLPLNVISPAVTPLPGSVPLSASVETGPLASSIDIRRG